MNDFTLIEAAANGFISRVKKLIISEAKKIENEKNSFGALFKKPFLAQRETQLNLLKEAYVQAVENVEKGEYLQDNLFQTCIDLLAGDQLYWNSFQKVLYELVKEVSEGNVFSCTSYSTFYFQKKWENSESLIKEKELQQAEKMRSLHLQLQKDINDLLSQIKKMQLTNSHLKDQLQNLEQEVTILKNQNELLKNYQGEMKAQWKKLFEMNQKSNKYAEHLQSLCAKNLLIRKKIYAEQSYDTCPKTPIEQALSDPYTGKLMVHPVVGPNGVSYEKTVFQQLYPGEKVVPNRAAESLSQSIIDERAKYYLNNNPFLLYPNPPVQSVETALESALAQKPQASQSQ